MFNLFRKKPKYKTCPECGVVHECGDEVLFSEYCTVHRKPKVERLENITKVKNWAERHWEELLPKALEEEREMHSKCLGGLAGLQAQAAQQARSLGGTYFGGLSAHNLFKP